MEPLHRLRVAGLAILDVLGLVKDGDREVLIEIRGLKVPLQERIRSDDDVRLGDLREVVRAVRARDDERLEVRSELLRLRLPVADERRRADDDRREIPSLRVVRARVGARKREPRERLERLSEAHFVREQPRQPRILQEAHPVDALLLVRTENAVELP